MAAFNIFITGATGYIGAYVLDRLLSHPSSQSYKLTLLIRSEEKAAKLLDVIKHDLVGGGGSASVEVVFGDNGDAEKLRKLAGEADVVFSIANADDVKAIEAILAGAKDRFAATGRKPTLIHTSGAGVLIDDARGDRSSSVVWKDTDADQIETISDDAPHRNVDLKVVEGDKEGYVLTHIIVPTAVFGIAQGRFVDAGIQNPYTIAFKAIALEGVERGQGVKHGEGRNVWGFVHVEDVADAFITLFNALFFPSPTSPPNSAMLGHGRTGYYFVENGELPFSLVFEGIAKTLAARGVGSEVPVANDKSPLVRFLGANARCEAVRLRALGWKPKHSKEETVDTLQGEVDAVLKRGRGV